LGWHLFPSPPRAPPKIDNGDEDQIHLEEDDEYSENEEEEKNAICASNAPWACATLHANKKSFASLHGVALQPIAQQSSIEEKAQQQQLLQFPSFLIFLPLKFHTIGVLTNELPLVAQFYQLSQHFLKFMAQKYFHDFTYIPIALKIQQF
jgi:hypothetical protein